MRIRLADAVTADISTARPLITGANRGADRYLYSYDIKTSLDDAVTLTVLSINGTSLEAVTTSSATSGQAAAFTFYWQLTGNETFTLTGIGSGTCTVDIFVVD